MKKKNLMKKNSWDKISNAKLKKKRLINVWLELCMKMRLRQSSTINSRLTCRRRTWWRIEPRTPTWVWFAHPASTCASRSGAPDVELQPDRIPSTRVAWTCHSNRSVECRWKYLNKSLASIINFNDINNECSLHERLNSS